jgi:menaquinone-dependent protoporphyrinogen oxidase
LIAYATRAGSTGDVAEAIGQVLQARGFRVDVRTVKSRPRVASYDIVLVGSAVRAGSWLPEAVDFVAAHQLSLKHVPVALFTVHMHNTGGDPQSVANRRAYLSQIRPLVYPVAEAYFSGAIDPVNLPLLDRWAVRALKAPVADHREWDKIRGWAQTILA